MLETKKKSYFFFRLARFWNKKRDRFAAALNVGTQRKNEIYIQLSKSTSLNDLVYWLQLLFSAGIATLGLVLNSSAVIIGAMLISPLMGPILSAGLALATGDLILGLRSLLNLILSTTIAIGFAVLLVWLLPFKESTPEIQARIIPNTLDLVIALFSGAIGSIAVCREVKGVVTSIPGVAIAVALMPPVCVVGYGIGLALSLNVNEGIKVATGGGLLYLTNLVAITFTAMVVFFLLRLDTGKVREKNHEWRNTDSESLGWLNLINRIPSLKKAREIRSVPLRIIMILLPLVIIFIPLSKSFSKLRSEIQVKQKQNQIKQTATDIWQKSYANGENDSIRSFLDEVRISEKDEKLEIFMRVFDNMPYSPAEKDEFKQKIADKLDRSIDKISLQLVEIPTSAMQTVKPQIVETPKPPTSAETKSNYLKNIENSLEGIIFPSGGKYIDYQATNNPNGQMILKIYYLNEKDLSEDAKQILAADALTDLNLPNTEFQFERITPQSFPIPFENNGANLRNDGGTILEVLGGILQNHPRLNLVVNVSKNLVENDNADTNNNSNSNPISTIEAEKEAVIRNYFLQNWNIGEKRFLFSEGADNFRLVLNE
ncbi:MAG: DUF389 domain-containing protein [Pyrinomonadaceae bacterium]